MSGLSVHRNTYASIYRCMHIFLAQKHEMYELYPTEEGATVAQLVERLTEGWTTKE
jgi:hypothetical protein